MNLFGKYQPGKILCSKRNTSRLRPINISHEWKCLDCCQWSPCQFYISSSFFFGGYCHHFLNDLMATCIVSMGRLETQQVFQPKKKISLFVVPFIFFDGQYRPSRWLIMLIEKRERERETKRNNYIWVYQPHSEFHFSNDGPIWMAGSIAIEAKQMAFL